MKEVGRVAMVAMAWITACGSPAEPPSPPAVDFGDCGAVWEGELTETGIWNDEGSERVLRSASDGWAETTFRLPGPEVERITFNVEGGVELFAKRPGADVPGLGTPFTDSPPFVVPYNVWRTVDDARFINIDFNSRLSLPDFREASDEMQLVFAAEDGPTDYRVAVECTEAPVIDSTVLSFVPLGEAVDASPSIHGHEDVLLSAAGELPDWATVRRSRVLGTPTEAGLYTIPLTVELPSGASKTEDFEVPVFVRTEVACGERVPFELDGPYGVDSRASFVQMTLDLSNLVSVSFELEGHPDATMTARQDASAVPSLASDLPIFRRLDYGPDRWPPRGVASELGSLTVSVYSAASGGSGELVIHCEPGPVPDLRVMPFLDVGIPATHPLEAIGGVPPLQWSATGLPAGVGVSSDGSYVHDGKALPGRYEVELSVVDSEGSEYVGTFTADVGVAAACGDAVPIECGDVLQGTFTAPWESDPEGGSRTLCLPRPEDDWLSVTVASDLAGLDVGVWPPGAPDFDGSLYSLAASFFAPTDDYVGMVFRGAELEVLRSRPTVFELRTREVGDYAVCLACGAGDPLLGGFGNFDCF